MRTYLDCYPCFLQQAMKTARIITTDEAIVKKVMDKTSAILPDISLDQTPPETGKVIYQLIREITGSEDPYWNHKQQHIAEAKSLYPYLKEKIRQSKNPLKTAIRIAIAGNVIDLGVEQEFDIKRDVETILKQEFAIDDTDLLISALSKAESILYIGDNAGETVFDKLFIEEMNKPVTYVTREKPVINDATIKDAHASGLDEVARIISSGSEAPGTILSLCNQEFKEIFESSDLIISKGQGNYEGLSRENRPVFFLLKAKCKIIARDIGVNKDDIIVKAHHVNMNS